METTKKHLILIVDDTLQNIQVLGNILYEKGYNINISTSGAHALQSANSEAPDLILLDIQMPVMDGFEVCRQLKTDSKTKDIPVIFLTAVADSENILHGFELGAVDYITKPFNVAELSMRVATHVDLKLSKEKLIELNATKDKFFSIIAHDLKNPFAGLLSSCELMQRSIVNQDLEKIKKYADSIQGASKDAYKLLENLLSWSRLQMGKFEVKKEKFNICSHINDALISLQYLFNEKEISMVVNCDENTETYFDIEMFKAIIRNFVTNAIKFSNKGKEIQINVIDSEEKYFKISVQDTGVGISKKNLTRLFRIDVSHSTPGTNDERGTGLGLLLCKEFAEKNNSEIFVESEEGKGSTFGFTVENLQNKINF